LPVGLGDDAQDGLVEAPSQELDLAPFDEPGDDVPALFFLGLHVFPKRTGKVQRELDRRMPAQLFEKRPVAVGESPAEDAREIPHRLMIVNAEEESDLTHQE
jgi:hypothetical protein